MTALTLKLHNYCAGLEVYHNTLASARSGFQSFDRWQNGHFRNNLILGGTGSAMITGSLTPYSTLDYNAYRRNNNTGPLIRWFDGTKRVDYSSLQDFNTGTGHERHGTMVDYDIFVRGRAPLEGISAEPVQYNLRLLPGAAPVDTGYRMPGINDDLIGRAPDLGCHERGAPSVHYGPRNRRRQLIRIHQCALPDDSWPDTDRLRSRRRWRDGDVRSGWLPASPFLLTTRSEAARLSSHELFSPGRFR